MREKLRIRKHLLLCAVLMGFGAPSRTQHADVPQLTAVVPETGITTPGTKVAVYGTNFSPDAIVYFGGLQARRTDFTSPSTLEVVTPYLRPGPVQLQVKSGGTTVRSKVMFAALPSPADTEIDRAVTLASQGQAPVAIAMLANIAKTNSDYEVQAFAHYQTAQIYFAQGDLWRWGGEASAIYDNADKSGPAVQTSWVYRLPSDQSTYLLPIDSNPDTPLKLADWTVEKDVTQNPEPRFFRALLNARYGNLEKAKTDSDFILSLYPNDPSYRALAAYIAVLAGDKTHLRSLSTETITGHRALSLLGEAAYLSGDAVEALHWWTLAAKDYPLGATLAYWAGKKHFSRGQKRVAEALLTECIAMAPDSKEAKEAKDLLVKLREQAPE
jgi:tetratricopeptide (TPR) repeat protein